LLYVEPAPIVEATAQYDGFVFIDDFRLAHFLDPRAMVYAAATSRLATSISANLPPAISWETIGAPSGSKTLRLALLRQARP
jgi:hypothetical protein